MAADNIAVLGLRHCSDDRAARMRVRRAPMDRETRLSAWLRMGGEANMVGAVRTAHDQVSQKANGPPVRRAWLNRGVDAEEPGSPPEPASEPLSNICVATPTIHAVSIYIYFSILLQERP